MTFRSVIRCLTFNRVYLSSMLFCACSSVTIAIGIINAYMLVLCLYMCIYIVCVAVPCLSCAGDQAGTACKLSLCLCFVLITLVCILINCILCKVLIMLSWAWRASGAVLCWLQLSEMHNVTFWFGVSARVRPCSMYGFRHKKKARPVGRACYEAAFMALRSAADRLVYRRRYRRADSLTSCKVYRDFLLIYIFRCVSFAMLIDSKYSQALSDLYYIRAFSARPIYQ